MAILLLTSEDLISYLCHPLHRLLLLILKQIGPALPQCWDNVFDVGPTLSQRWVMTFHLVRLRQIMTASKHHLVIPVTDHCPLIADHINGRTGQAWPWPSNHGFSQRRRSSVNSVFSILTLRSPHPLKWSLRPASWPPDRYSKPLLSVSSGHRRPDLPNSSCPSVGIFLCDLLPPVVCPWGFLFDKIDNNTSLIMTRKLNVKLPVCETKFNPFNTNHEQTNGVRN